MASRFACAIEPWRMPLFVSPEGPIVARGQSFGEKLRLAQAVTAQALVYRWAGSVESVCCLRLFFGELAPCFRQI